MKGLTVLLSFVICWYIFVIPVNILSLHILFCFFYFWYCAVVNASIFWSAVHFGSWCSSIQPLWYLHRAVHIQRGNSHILRGYIYFFLLCCRIHYKDSTASAVVSGQAGMEFLFPRGAPTVLCTGSSKGLITPSVLATFEQCSHITKAVSNICFCSAKLPLSWPTNFSILFSLPSHCAAREGSDETVMWAHGVQPWSIHHKS